MTLTHASSGLLMKMAGALAPSEHKTWAQAMDAEFETLSSGRLAWACGCLVTALGWRLRQDAVFLTALVLAPELTEQLLAWLEFWLPGRLGIAVLRWLSYAQVWGLMALLSGALAAWRPRRWVLVSIAMPLLSQTFECVKFSVAFHQPLHTAWRIHLMDARLDVGLGSMIGYAFLGALIGQTLVRRAVPGAFPAETGVSGGSQKGFR